MECCAALAERYGANSTAPTANCFCVPEYWSLQSELSSEFRASPTFWLQLSNTPCTARRERLLSRLQAYL